MREPELICINCDSLNLKFISDNLYKCLVCGEFIDNDEKPPLERIKQHKERNEQ